MYLKNYYNVRNYTVINMISTICQLHDKILESCIKLTVKAISRSKPLCKNKHRTIIPGWTDEHSVIAFGLIAINLKLDGFQK